MVEIVGIGNVVEMLGIVRDGARWLEMVEMARWLIWLELVGMVRDGVDCYRW